MFPHRHPLPSSWLRRFRMNAGTSGVHAKQQRLTGLDTARGKARMSYADGQNNVSIR
jgi:hypothetical protein